MKKTALALLTLALLVPFAYADDSDNSVNLTGKLVKERALGSEKSMAAGAEVSPDLMKKDIKHQESDEWTIRSNRENYDTH